MKRIVALILAVLMMAFAFSSCVFGGFGEGEQTTAGDTTTADITTGDSASDNTTAEPGSNGTTSPEGTTADPGSNTTTADPEGTTPPSVAEKEEPFKPEVAKVLDLIVDGRSKANIIYSADDSNADDKAKELRQKIRDILGINVSIKPDSSVVANSDTVEILLGYTNRPESEAMRKFIGFNDYGVFVYGNKLIIAGWFEDTQNKAIEKFAEMYLKNTGVRTLSANSDNNYATTAYYVLNGMVSKGDKAKLAVGSYYYKYSIVLPKDYSYTEYRFALRLRESIGKQTGVVLDIVTDDKSTSEYEILIGKTERTTATVQNFEYLINVKGNRVELISDSYYGYDYLYNYCSKSIFSNLNSATKDCGELKKENYSTQLKKDGSESFLSKDGDLRIIYNNVFGFDSMTTTPNGSCMPGIRNPMIAEFYKDFDADVLCFEEINAPMRGTSPLTSLLAEYGYEEVSEGKCSTPIFYNKATLERLAAEEINFNQALAGIQGVLSIQGDKYMTWAVFEVIETKKKFAVINVHMDSFDDNGEGTGAIEAAAQVQLIMKTAADLYSQYSCAVLVGGDMNTTISEATCQTLVRNGYVDVQSIAAKTDSNQGNFHKVPYMVYNETVGGAYFTGEAQTNDNYAESVDHIFASPYAKTAIEFKRFDILSDASVSSFADHCAMVFDFNIK